MQIEISTSHTRTSDAMMQHVYDKLEHELKYVIDHVTRVEVHIQDLNGPRGGRDQHCMMEARIAGQNPLAVENTANDAYLAVDGAAEKLARAVTTRLEKMRER